MLRETDGTCWDNGYTHAWTQVHAALRSRGIVHRKAPPHGARPRPAPSRAARSRSRSPPPHPLRWRARWQQRGGRRSRASSTRRS
eukprot:2237214-Prymnesium_polylepis.1